MGERVVRRAASPVFVGRRAELAALRAALDDAGAGRTVAVLVGGEAGAGKSRLVAEFTGTVVAPGARVLTGGCLALGAESLPYAPFTQALGQRVGELGPVGVDDLLGPGRVELARLLPELRRPDDDARAAAGHDRAVLFQVILRALERAAGAGPVVLALEALHWADASSRELLASLIGCLRGPVLLVATYRNDGIHRRHPLRPFLTEAARSERVVRIDLGRLDAAEVAEQLEAIAGAALPRPVVRPSWPGPRAIRSSPRSCWPPEEARSSRPTWPRSSRPPLGAARGGPGAGRRGGRRRAPGAPRAPGRGGRAVGPRADRRSP